MANKIVVLEDHDDLYYYWKAKGVKNIHLIHLDPHCDLYGAFINLSGNYMIEIRKQRLIDEGNFLVPVIKEEVVKRVRWVHDEYGGRKYDDTTVTFEHDLTGKIQLLKFFLAKPAIYKIDFSIEEYNSWFGPLEGEHLSIDWDFFALKIKDKGKIVEEFEAFIKRDWNIIPDYTYICYSHEYVHSSILTFLKFVNKLAQVFGAEIEFFKPEKPYKFPPHSSFPTRLLKTVWCSLKTKGIIWLHQHGVF